MDIVVWLRSLGLGKYEAAFRENDIDETVLPSLTEEHLKQLGVKALGHLAEATRCDRQPPDPEITSPNSLQVLPSNFANCICLMGAKSSVLVDIVIPGNTIGSF